MTTLFISDLHLAPERPEIVELFRQFVKTEAVQADAVYILGDLFEYWVGDDAAETLGHTDTLRSLAYLRDRGVPTYFMPGNRDFLIGRRFCARTGCQLLQDPNRVNIYGREMLLTHGDSLCTDDSEHQRFRKMVNDPSWQSAFLAQPMEQRIRLAVDAREQSEFNKSRLPMEVMDVNQQSVESTIRRFKIDTLIHGHTHRPAIHRFQLDGTDVQRIVLGDWYRQSSVLRLTRSGVHLTPGNLRS